MRFTTSVMAAFYFGESVAEPWCRARSLTGTLNRNRATEPCFSCSDKSPCPLLKGSVNDTKIKCHHKKCFFSLHMHYQTSVHLY